MFEKLIKESKGKFITVTFIKRTDNTVRVMNCQFREEKHDIARNKPEKNNLIVVWDLKAKAYRSISIENIQEVKIDGVVIKKAERKDRKHAVLGKTG